MFRWAKSIRESANFVIGYWLLVIGYWGWMVRYTGATMAGSGDQIRRGRFIF